jgi:hypothetical protein
MVDQITGKLNPSVLLHGGDGVGRHGGFRLGEE